MTKQERPAVVGVDVLKPIRAQIRRDPEAERPQVEIDTWKPKDVDAIFALEKRTWPPWLVKPKDRIMVIAQDPIKSSTHFTAKDHTGKVVGIMSVTRTKWNGKPEDLETWDRYAGGSVTESSYPKYDPDGNTLVIMSSSVDPAYQGKGIARKLFDKLQEVANTKNSGIKHLIGPFRPSGWGAYKRNQHKPRISFEDYCEQVIAGEEEDPWLQAARNMGMEPIRIGEHLRVEDFSMTVVVPFKKFKKYKDTYKKNKWQWDEVYGIWECDEAGRWIVVGEEDDPDAFAFYAEPNLLGEIPLKQDSE